MKQRVCLTAFICIVFLSTYACRTAPKKEAGINSSSVCENVVYSDKPDKVTEPPFASEKERRIEAAYEVLMSGSNGKDLQTAVIETQEALDNLYGRLYGSDGIRAPKIDFKKKKVIAVSAGTFNTGGYTVNLYSAVKIGDTLQTMFRVHSPAPDQIVTQAFTRPYIIICITAFESTRISVTIEGGNKNFLNRRFEY